MAIRSSSRGIFRRGMKERKDLSRRGGRGAAASKSQDLKREPWKLGRGRGRVEGRGKTGCTQNLSGSLLFWATAGLCTGSDLVY